VPNAQELEAKSPSAEQIANVIPDVGAVAGQTRLLINAIDASTRELKDDVRDIKSHRHSDFVYMISVFAAGFILLAGMLITVYLLLDGRIEKLTISSVRSETKLEDLLQRVPPILPPPPKQKSN
jgi:hypothetical protein